MTIDSLLEFLAIFVLWCPDSRIMATDEQMANTLSQPNVFPPVNDYYGYNGFIAETSIDTNYMLTTPVPNLPMAPGLPQAPTVLNTGMVTPSVTPVQVYNAPIVPSVDVYHMLNGSSVAINTVVRPASTNILPISPPSMDTAFMMEASVAPAWVNTMESVQMVTEMPPSINTSYMLTSSSVAPIPINSPTPATSPSTFATGKTPMSTMTTQSPVLSTPFTTGIPPTTSSPGPGEVVPLSAPPSTVATPKVDSLISSTSNSTESSLTPTTTCRYEHLRFDCPDRIVDLEKKVSTTLPNSDSSNTILNSSLMIPMLGITFPSEIKIYLNITSMPNIFVNISTEPPVTQVDEETVVIEVINGSINISSKDPSNSLNIPSEPPVTEVTEEAVEVIEGEENISTTPQSQDIVFEDSFENNVSESHIYIDLSDPNRGVDFGMATLKPMEPPIQLIPSTTTPVVTLMKFEEKCLEYYNIGRRTTRKTKVQVFIIGGTNSAQKEFPHMAALGYGKKSEKQWLCGGSLISENYVITAAHCLTAKSIGAIQYVRLGTTTLQTETLNSEDFDVVRRIPHPSYVPGKQYNDIALLQLDRPALFSDFIAPICLKSNMDLTNARLIATGWGKIVADGDASPELHKVELEYFSHEACQRAYDAISIGDLPNGILEERQICAGAIDGSRDTCQGDSGGPLQLQQDGRMYLIGITSFGIGCGKPDSPGVYTKVSYYIPWIENIVWGV